MRRLKELLTPSNRNDVSSSSGNETNENAQSANPLRNHPYYHGMLPREDTEILLQKAGDYLLRTTEMKGRKSLILSVRAVEGVDHFLVKQTDTGMWQLLTRSFGSISDLVEFYASTKHPIDEKHPDTVLLHALPRQRWQLKHEQIDCKRRVGSGAFGEVWFATQQLDDTGRFRRVAIKCLPQGVVADKTQRETLMREARLMRDYAHRNVIRLLGVAVDREPLMLVLEWAPEGALNDYLRAHPNLDHQQLVRFCVHAAQGLRYLEKHGTIHRDVAARNCLLGADLEVKIADFGLSQREKLYKEHSGSKMPIRWLAPESLTQFVFTLKSDVWSFGVLVWEVFSGGQDPYPGMTNAQVRHVVVHEGYRLPMPVGTPDDVSDLVAGCWNENPEARPNFLELKLLLRRVHDRLGKRFNIRNIISDRIAPKNG